MWSPGRLEGGQTIDDPVSTVDVFATLLDAAGVAIPGDRPLDGWSFLPRLRGGTKPHREWVTFHHHPRPKTRADSEPLRWARDARWQLFDDGRLYDVLGDPELQEIIPDGTDDPAARKARARLERALATLPEPGA